MVRQARGLAGVPQRVFWPAESWPVRRSTSFMSGTMAMVDSYHAAVRAMDERTETVGEVLEDVVHGPIQ